MRRPFARSFKCLACRNGLVVEHKAIRATDARNGIYGGIWGFYVCPEGHETGWDISERDYETLRAALDAPAAEQGSLL